MTLLNGQGLFVAAYSGLTSTYSTLAKYSSSTNGTLSLEDLTNLSDEATAALGSNTNFLQYLTSNFSNLDSDGDGKINASDISKLTTTMQQKGLTYNEIAQLCASGSTAIDSSLMSTVLNYFNKIDKNNDGRVTSQEIAAFSYETDRQELDTKYNSFKSSSLSVFYKDSSEDEAPSSIVDNMYPIKKSNS